MDLVVLASKEKWDDQILFSVSQADNRDPSSFESLKVNREPAGFAFKYSIYPLKEGLDVLEGWFVDSLLLELLIPIGPLIRDEACCAGAEVMNGYLSPAPFPEDRGGVDDW